MANFRLFHLTIGVYLPEDEPLPITFADWIERAGLSYEGATPTFLDSVVELRYPLSRDIVERRTGDVCY